MAPHRRQILGGGAILLAGWPLACARRAEGETPMAPIDHEPPGSIRPPAAAVRVDTLRRPRGPAPLVFAGGRLGQLRPDSLVVRRVSDWAVVATVALEDGVGVGALADDSLLALEAPAQMAGWSRAVRLEPRSGRARRYHGLAREAAPVHILPLPEPDCFARMGPESDDVQKIALAEPAAAQLADAIRVGRERHGALTPLADGSILAFASDRALERAAFGASARRYELPVPAQAAAAGPDPDTTWLVGDDLLLVALSEPVRVLARTAAPTHWLHAASGGRRLFVLSADGAEVSPDRRFTLAAFDDRARPLWSAPLAIAGDGAARLAARWVAASPDHVAVGNGEELEVFDAASGDRLLPPS